MFWSPEWLFSLPFFPFKSFSGQTNSSSATSDGFNSSLGHDSAILDPSLRSTSRSPKMDYDLSDISDLSSVPSSPRSSPEPTKRYLTPSSQSSQEGEDSTRQDCPPRKKRRRNPLPKERTTQYLSLSKSSYEQQDQVRLLVETLRHQKDIVVIAGAGISTSAGSKFSCSCVSHSPGAQAHTTYSSRFPLHRWSFQVLAKETQLEGFWQAFV